MTTDDRQAVIQHLRRKCLDVRRDIVDMIYLFLFVAYAACL